MKNQGPILVFDGDSSVLALRFSWRFAFPGDSRVLATPNTSWHGGPCFGRTSTSTQSRFLVAFGAPAPSSSFCLPMPMRLNTAETYVTLILGTAVVVPRTLRITIRIAPW